VVKDVNELDVDSEGAGTTVPLTATDLLVAPELATPMLPLGEPATAEAAIRTEMVPEADPLLSLTVAVCPKLVPLLETSKPVGAVTVTLPVRFAPLTVKVCAAEAVPAVAVKLPRDAGLTLKDGGALTVPETASVRDVAPALATLILPVKTPAKALAAMRTSKFVEETTPPA
jgi:hypothetical protein